MGGLKNIVDFEHQPSTGYYIDNINQRYDPDEINPDDSRGAFVSDRVEVPVHQDTYIVTVHIEKLAKVLKINLAGKER